MATSKKEKVIIIPCSGIGKATGTVGRKATYKVIEKLRPTKARTVCLSRLTIGDQEILELVRTNPCIAVDGCPLNCARKNVEASTGKLVAAFMVTDVLKEHRNLKPEGVTKLGPQGKKLANLLAQKVAKEVDAIKVGDEADASDKE